LFEIRRFALERSLTARPTRTREKRLALWVYHLRAPVAANVMPHDKLRWFPLLRNATTGGRLVFLLAFLAITIFYGAWSIWRFHISAPMWLVFLSSIPWSVPLSSGALAIGQPFSGVLSAASVCLGFAINVTVTYVAVRFVFAVRHNRTFERDAPQAARPSM